MKKKNPSLFRPGEYRQNSSFWDNSIHPRAFLSIFGANFSHSSVLGVVKVTLSLNRHWLEFPISPGYISNCWFKCTDE